MTTLSSDDDDWFYDSISRYKYIILSINMKGILPLSSSYRDDVLDFG